MGDGVLELSLEEGVMVKVLLDGGGGWVRKLVEIGCFEVFERDIGGCVWGMDV